MPKLTAEKDFVKPREVLQKFCIARAFSACGNTSLKLHEHITEGIPSTHAEFCSNRLKIMWR